MACENSVGVYPLEESRAGTHCFVLVEEAPEDTVRWAIVGVALLLDAVSQALEGEELPFLGSLLAGGDRRRACWAYDSFCVVQAMDNLLQ